MTTPGILAVLGCVLLAPSALRAAEVTFERLRNPEPQNWLMNHHDFGAQRFSALDRINKSNVKTLKLAFAVALGGTSGNENLVTTPGRWIRARRRSSATAASRCGEIW
jgi:alcohol dehydrogenase (cytochrome c)